MSARNALPPAIDRFRADVFSGLSKPQKQLPSKYFYDVAGSRLFDRITELPEYYPTRIELAIVRDHAADMAHRCGPECLVIELGAGSLFKVRLLLDSLSEPAGYVAVDVSGEHLEDAAHDLANDYPNLSIYPIVADFTRFFRVPELPAARRIVYFPGSTIGNFDPPDADALMRRLAGIVGTGGGLLLGVDLRTDQDVLERAYNDVSGVTAAFNRNLLVRINRELGADFNVEAFQHRSFYNAERSRIEMHLVSAWHQRVRIGDYSFPFRKGETIHTENSYKYEPAELVRKAADWGFRVDEMWTDKNRYFAVLYLTAAK